MKFIEDTLKEMNLELYDVVPLFKNYGNLEYVLDKDSQKLIKQYYSIYNVRKDCSLEDFTKAVMNCSIFDNLDLHTTLEKLCNILYKKYRV